MKKITLIIDGKEIEAQVNEEDLKEVEKEREFGRQEEGIVYFYFDNRFNSCEMIESGDIVNSYDFDFGNYFLTEKECADAAEMVSSLLLTKRQINEVFYNKKEARNLFHAFVDKLYSYCFSEYGKEN